MQPASVVTPASAAEVAEVLAGAAAAGLVVAPVGAGSALALGNVPERVDSALSTAGLAGIIAYEPTDLTLSVGAGARFADVQAVLAEHGQGLPLDVAHPETATIGGLIATALAGPRRLGSGTLRDLLIGISVAHPSGTVTTAGGFVVKNVTGFDLPRLYHGSLGTLGVIVSANFKILPLPRADATLVTRYDGLDAALDAASGIQTSRVRPVALEVARDGAGWLVALRLVGREPAVAALLTEASALLGASGATYESGESARWWQSYVDEQAVEVRSPSEMLVRLAVRPRGTAETARALVRQLDEADVADYDLAISPGLGLLTARVRFTDGDDARLAEWQARWLDLAVHVTILAAPPAWKTALDVWGRPPATLDVMRALKAQFDPGRVLNRGRFAGRI